MSAPEIDERDRGASWSDAGAFVVLGATGTIGGRVAAMLDERGATVVRAGRSADGDGALKVDPTSFEEVERALTESAERSGGALGGVASCVGSILLKPADRTTREEWDDVVTANLTTAFATLRAAGTTLRDGGSVVLCSSAAARIGLPHHEAIAAAKAGVEGLVRAAAASYATRRLRVNAVAPGLVDTKASARLLSSDAAVERSSRMHPLGRVGRPDDVAAAIVWLLDPANDWITGQVLPVDGGLSSVRPPTRV